MAGRIRQDDIESVHERTDLVKVVADYLPLKKTGRDSLSGLCPFHPEKTPSFSVIPAKQVYHCFGCGEGGDAITFLRELEHLTYVEAVERLAQQAGVTLRYEGDSPAERRAAQRRAALIKANEQAGDLFRQMLADGRGRRGPGLPRRPAASRPESVRARFGLGYAPTYADFLLRRLQGRASSARGLLPKRGLATRGDDGTCATASAAHHLPHPRPPGPPSGSAPPPPRADPRRGRPGEVPKPAESPIYRKN